MVGYWINCGTGAKWLIFMTDLGFMFLTLHYVIDAILVVCRYTWERCYPDETCKYEHLVLGSLQFLNTI